MAMGTTSTITIEYFGPAKDYTENRSDEKISLPHPQDSSFASSTDGPTLNDVLRFLSDKYSREFGGFIMRSCGIALNYDYLEIERNVNDENKADDGSDIESLLNEFGKGIAVDDGDTITIIPPVSSG